MIEANEAFQRWIKRFGSRPWEDELQKAFEAGYRVGMRYDQTTKHKPRTPNHKRFVSGPNKGKLRKPNTFGTIKTE